MLANMDADEIQKEKAEHKVSLMQSRVQEIQRLRAAKAQKLLELKKKREEAIKDAAAALLKFGKIIDWNAIVTAKRKKLRSLEKIERERLNRDKENPLFENLREFMYKTIVDQSSREDVPGIFQAFRSVQPYPLRNVTKEFEVARQFQSDHLMSLNDINMVAALKTSYTNAFLKEKESKKETTNVRQNAIHKAEIMVKQSTAYLKELGERENALMVRQMRE